MCQSDRTLGGYGSQKPELSSMRIICRKQMEEDRGMVGVVEEDPEWKQNDEILETRG